MGDIAALTALEHPPGDRKRVRICLDGEHWRTTNRRVARALELVAGGSVDPDDLAERLDEEEQRQAKDHALQFLTYRARSHSELERKLREVGYGQPAIQSTLSFLDRAGYLDDDSFAEQWIAERVRVKQYGRRRIVGELVAKGIDPAEVADMLDEYCPDSGEADRARAIFKRRLAGHSGLDRLAAARRVGPYLLRKGFSSAAVASAMRDASEESVDPERLGDLAGECPSL